MSDNEESNNRNFRVIDRRFWATAEEDEHEDKEKEKDEDTDGEEIAKQPTGVGAIEQALEEKHRKLQQCIESHQESLEEFERAKDRMKREVSKEAERIKQNLILDFLEVLDNLERALDNADTNQDQSLIEGVALVRNLFKSKLATYGITKIEAVGVKFDPQRHEAVTAVPTEDPKLDGMVLQVIRNGYAMSDKILRPVGAVVAKLSI